MLSFVLQQAKMIPERDLWRFITPIFFLFQLFGLFPIDIKSKRNRTTKVFLWIYSFGLAMVTAICGIFYVHNRIEMCNFYVNVAIDKAMWLCALVAHIITCIEVFATMPRHVKLLERIQTVMEEFSKRRSFGIDLNLLRQRLVFRNWSSFFAIVFSVALIGMVSEDTARVDFRWTAMSSCIIQLRLLQVTMYVHIANDLLGQLKKKLVRIGSQSGRRTRCNAIVECIQIYTMIGDIVGQLNAVFGWSLIAILLQNVSAITNASYWTVYNLYYMQRYEVNLCECTSRILNTIT